MESLNINLSNIEKLEQMLTEMQKGTKQRNVSCADVVEAVAKAEAKLTELGLPKKLHKGAVLIVTPSFRLPNSYRYSADYTRVVLERRATGWIVTAAGRKGGGSSSGPMLILSNEQQLATPLIFAL